MSASRMKNLILLVLTLCALGLLCIVVPNRLAQTHEQRQMLQELKTLYEGYDLSIDLDELPRSPTLYIVELSEDGAQTAAQALLGAKTAPAGASGFESTYESDLGTLHITRTGGFSASLTGGSRVRNPEKAAEKLLHAMDFQYQKIRKKPQRSCCTPWIFNTSRSHASRQKAALCVSAPHRRCSASLCSAVFWS